MLSEHWRSAREYVEEVLPLPYFQRYLAVTEPLYAVPRSVLVLTPTAPRPTPPDPTRPGPLRRAMTTLDPASQHVVLINTFTVEPERAEELLQALSAAIATSFDPVHYELRETHAA